jgi:hypothetical protein
VGGAPSRSNTPRRAFDEKPNTPDTTMSAISFSALAPRVTHARQGRFAGKRVSQVCYFFTPLEFILHQKFCEACTSWSLDKRFCSWDGEERPADPRSCVLRCRARLYGAPLRALCNAHVAAGGVWSGGAVSSSLRIARRVTRHRVLTGSGWKKFLSQRKRS